MSFESELCHSLVYQDVEFFDDKANQVGPLSQLFSKDTLQMAAYTGIPMSMQIQICFALMTAIGVGLGRDWRVGLVTLGLWLILTPLIAMAGRAVVGLSSPLEDVSGTNDRSVKNSTAGIMNETLDNILVVNQFTMGREILADFRRALQEELKSSRKDNFKLGLITAFLITIFFLAELILLILVGFLLASGVVEFERSYVVSSLTRYYIRPFLLSRQCKP